MSKDYKYYFSSSNKENIGMQEAFLDGYIAALKCHRIYDPALFLEGRYSELCIIGNLIAQEKRAEDAARSQARMIMNSFGACTATEKAREFIKQSAREEVLRPQIDSNTITLEGDTPSAVDVLITDIIGNLPKGLETLPPITLLNGEEKSAVAVVTEAIRKYIEASTE